MKPKILITFQPPEEMVPVLERHFRVEAAVRKRGYSGKEIREKVKGVDGLLATITHPVDEPLLKAAGPRLKVIANYGVGFNHIDLAAATARGLAVTNTPGVLTESTADLAMALILAVSRRVVEGDALARSGKFKGWSPLFFLGTDVHHKTLGIIGLGRIGMALARRGAAFGMPILYTSRVRLPPDREKALGIRWADRETLLRRSDFVSLHVPLTPETYHLIGPRELGLMKPSAFLINTSRGEVVDETALVRSLRAKSIAGAGLDVYEKEPRIHPGLIRLKNVVLLPHLGSATRETRVRMGLTAAENLIAFFQGKTPPNCLNPEVLRGGKAKAGR
jgi:glyoxylate reductase